jgi:signal transduction histidine kinase
MSERGNGGEGSEALEGNPFFGSAPSLAPTLVAAAHELKAPLALIRQLGLTLEEADLLDLPEAERAKIIRRIVLSAERSLRVSDALTKSARLEDGLFEMEPINILQIAEEVAHELMPLARESGRELRVIKKTVPLALANRELVRQVAFNLCENAINYSSESKPIIFELSPQSAGKRVRLGIRDEGPKGFDGALARLAKNLGRAPTEFAPRPRSSGLGLYVSDKCARAMNGSLGLIRHPKGSTFYLELIASRQMDLF